MSVDEKDAWSLRYVGLSESLILQNTNSDSGRKSASTYVIPIYKLHVVL